MLLFRVGLESNLHGLVDKLPRAEVALFVMHGGRKLGADAVPPEVYGAMVIISAATCLVSPMVIAWLLRRWPQGGSPESAGPGAGGGRDCSV